MNAILHNPPAAAALARLTQDPRYNSTLAPPAWPRASAPVNAHNALPQTAQANVNCRILPGHTPDETRQTLIRIIADSKVAVRYGGIRNAARRARDRRNGTAPPTASTRSPPACRVTDSAVSDSIKTMSARMARTNASA